MVRSLRLAFLCGAAGVGLSACEVLTEPMDRDPPSLILQSGPAEESPEDVLSELTPTRDLLMQHADPEPNVVGPYTFNDRWPADISREFLTDLQRAIAECDRAAYDAARQRWLDQGYDPNHRARSPSEAVNDRERHDLETLSRVYNERPRFPVPCPPGSRPGPRLTIGGYYGWGHEADFGFGTRVTNNGEIRIVNAEVEYIEGLRLSAEISPRGLSGTIGLGLDYAEGEGSDAFSAPANGEDDFGFTFLREKMFMGGGSSTGLFFGNAFDIEARADTELQRGEAWVRYWPHRWTWTPWGGEGRLGVGVGYVDVRREGDAWGGASTPGFPNGITNEMFYWAEDRIYGTEFLGEAEWPLSPRFTADLRGAVGFGHGESDAYMKQYVRCSFCADPFDEIRRRVRFSEEGAVWTAGVEAGLNYQLTPSASLRAWAGYGRDWEQARGWVPANPSDDPAAFRRKGDGIGYLGASLGLRF